MDQFTLYAVERQGASALPASAASARPGSREFERWARKVRMLRGAREVRLTVRLERRSRRLRARLLAVETQLGLPPRAVAAEC